MLEQCAPGTRWHARAREIPEQPEVWLGLEPYYRAFWSLTGSRQMGMGLGPIPWSEVEHYGLARGFDGEQREDLHHYVAALDDTYLKHLGKTREKGRKHGNQPQSGVVRPKNPKGGRGHRARGG